MYIRVQFNPSKKAAFNFLQKVIFLKNATLYKKMSPYVILLLY